MGSNLAKEDVLLRVIKICSMTSFRGKITLLVPCLKILWHVKDPYRYEKRHLYVNSWQFFPKFLLLWLLGVCAGIFQRALVD
jgi:hypothetical protein